MVHKIFQPRATECSKPLEATQLLRLKSSQFYKQGGYYIKNTWKNDYIIQI